MTGVNIYSRFSIINTHCLLFFHVSTGNRLSATLAWAPCSVCKGLIIYTVDYKAPLVLVIPLPSGPFMAH